MADLPSLLTCLLRTPGDDVLWLAVADCLEEGGEPLRAELVRLNRRLREMEEDDERWRAEGRVRELVNGGVVPCVPELANSVEMRFALIPAGTFWMGSPRGEPHRNTDEGPRHLVTLTRSYCLGVAPVTRGQYAAVTGVRRGRSSPRGAAKVRKGTAGALPVGNVSWDEAVAFCEAMSALKEEKEAGRVYRLPTEAEWEHACRAGMRSGAFFFGDELDTRQANIREERLRRGSAAGEHLPNAWGLYDMHGNVWEWTATRYGPYPAGPVTDPAGPDTGTLWVYRGGSWKYEQWTSRAAYRVNFQPTTRFEDVGFRVAVNWEGTG
jgi:uncharacterized protein (TIGR02996 family)